MSETKHTPGPWRYQAEVTLEPGRLPRKVFEVYNVGGAFGHPASCDREADARLIAAAPELLAIVMHLPWELAHYPKDHPLVVMVDAALRKAGVSA